jgi:hypothetical protein
MRIDPIAPRRSREAKMPARTARCLFFNKTDFEMTLDSSDDLDWGVYTGSWHPPKVISGQSRAEWRSESDGAAQGTEGYLTYRIGVPDQGNGHTEFVKIHWDNPYIGVNSCDQSVILDFSGDNSTDIQEAHTITSNVPPNLEEMADGDVEAWIDAVLFPPFIFANANTAGNDAIALFEIRQPPQPPQNQFDFPQPGTRTQHENVNLDPAQWAGVWVGQGVYVTIVHAGGVRMTAQVTDSTTNPQLQFSEDFILGTLHWAATHSVADLLSSQVEASVGRGPARLVAAVAARALGDANSHTAAGERFTQMLYKEAATANLDLDGDNVIKYASAVSHFAKQSKSTVMLSNRIFLTLYDVFEGRTLRTRTLHYERHGPAGMVLSSEMLTWYDPSIH